MLRFSQQQIERYPPKFAWEWRNHERIYSMSMEICLTIGRHSELDRRKVRWIDQGPFDSKHAMMINDTDEINDHIEKLNVDEMSNVHHDQNTDYQEHLELVFDRFLHWYSIWERWSSFSIYAYISLFLSAASICRRIFKKTKPNERRETWRKQKRCRLYVCVHERKEKQR